MTATTDTTEAGLEALIVREMTERGWSEGDSRAYDREFAVDLAQLTGFLEATQPDVAEGVGVRDDSPTRRKFLSRLQGEITKRGIVDVLRGGIQTGPHEVTLFYGSPSPRNPEAAERHALNRFVVTRQVRYSNDESQLALDLALLVNGLPVATFELKNSLTKQTVEDAVEQYRRDRDPRELIFELGRCLAHFAVDDAEIRFCTELKGKASWFLPFNKGADHGAGNPPNPDGLKTDYLWRAVLAPASLTEIIEDYAALISEKDPETGRTTRTQLFPRYHQLDVVRKLLADAAERGAGRRYLVQHSAGSGKSNSIAWLAHGLVDLERDGEPVFDSVVVVTDRRILDRQITATVKQFAQVGATVGHAERSGDLRRFIESGKKIIVSTVQKFPFILDEIGSEHAGGSFAIVIDEAHSSQGGETAKAMSQALSGGVPDGESYEDQINRVIESRKMLANASYFAFTATPKNKTLELFGEAYAGADGETAHRPFHTYTMKQAIQEGFIVDVLANYTPVYSYYKLVRTVEDDPEFDVRKASAKLRRFVESNLHAIRVKAEIMVDHFHDRVYGKRKIGGEARAMVVTGSIERALDYYHAIKAYLGERNSPLAALVAFSGEHDYQGKRVSEASLNGFPANQISEQIREDPYRILVCADKFQTGYDEPLLHTMYVDKPLAGVQAVQTLSRLNRAHPAKYDTFVLDFANNAETIEAAFSHYYRTTVLSEETDPDKLHDLSAALRSAGVFDDAQARELARLFLAGAEVSELHPILDACVAAYNSELDEDEQVSFKGDAKAFVRTYGFLGQILPWSKPEWEELAILLNLLIPKLPAPKEEDLARGILETIDMDSYRAEKRKGGAIELPDEDAEIGGVPTDAGAGRKPEPETDRLSNILKAFNDMFGDIEWNDRDRVERILTQELPAKVGADKKYRNAMANSDRQNARIEHDAALGRAMQSFLADDTQLFKQFSDNEDFRRWVTELMFSETYEPGRPGGEQAQLIGH